MKTLEHARSTSIRIIVTGLILTVPAGLVAWGGGDRSWEWKFRTFVFAMLTLGAFVGITLVIAGVIAPRFNFALRGLARYGDPVHVSKSIDDELDDSAERFEFGQRMESFMMTSSAFAPIVLTPTWLIQKNELTLKIAALDRITRCYKKVVTVNGLQSYDALVVHECDGRAAERAGERVVEFGQASDEIDKALLALRRVIPGAIFGA